MSTGKLLVIISVAGAAVFGLYLGYLAYSNDSFPARTAPFGDYANVTGTAFNGTEYYFGLTWLSGNYVPLYAQLNSDTSQAANSPVCDLNMSTAQNGQRIGMTFAITPISSSLRDVDLSMAVRATNGTEFTIVYHVVSVDEQPGASVPTTHECYQPSAPL